MLISCFKLYIEAKASVECAKECLKKGYKKEANGWLAKLVTSTKSLDTMGDYY